MTRHTYSVLHCCHHISKVLNLAASKGSKTVMMKHLLQDWPISCAVGGEVGNLVGLVVALTFVVHS